jgi:hypothetical protein
LKSSVRGTLAGPSWPAPAMKASISSCVAPMSDTFSGPLPPWNGPAPRRLPSDRMKYGSTSS